MRISCCRSHTLATLSFAFFALLLSTFALPASAQIGPGPFSAFPTADETDTRMLSFGCAGIATFEQVVTLTVAAPPTMSNFTLSFFDGDTGRQDSMGKDHWDLGTRQLLYQLYFDPLREGNTNPADLVGEWYGNDPNPATSPSPDPNKQWTTTDTFMVDNGWWGVTVDTAPPALSPSGLYSYNLVIQTDGVCMGGESLASDLKIAGDAPLTFLVPRFGFEASFRSIANDGPIIYDPFTFVDPLNSATTYDGTFDFYLNVEEADVQLRLFDGDFDHGVNPAQLVGVPSGVLLELCVDNDDPDTGPTYSTFPFTPAGANPETAVVAGGFPPDDNRFDLARRGEVDDPNEVGCIRYDVIDPLGNVYANPNPSGNLEWEKFRIATSLATDSANSDYVVPGDTLPPGIWQVRIVGLDLANLNFWFFETAACSVQDGVPVCPGNAFVIGDTVFFDTNGNGVQDAGEPGIPGVIVNIYRDPAELPISTVITGDASNPDWDECVSNNTGLDTDGLYCFGTDTISDYTVEIAPENFQPGGALEGTASTTGGEQQSDTLTDDNVLTYDFGYLAVGSIGDRLWFDDDGDGVQDGGEAGINGVTVNLRDSGGTIIAMAMTSGDGNYLFENLLAGTYTVEVVAGTLPPGLIPTYDLDGTGTPNTATLSLGSGEDRRDADFGYLQPASIGDRLWRDDDGDGVQDGGEPGLNGVTVKLLDDGGNVIATTVTAGDGNYLFENLPAGTYTVQVVESTLPADYVPTYDLDGLSSPNRATLTVDAGDERRDVDFGYALCGECEGKVSSLTLQYLGGSDAFIEVKGQRGPSKNELLFSGNVPAGGSFTIVGPASGKGGFVGTVGTNIDLYVDSAQNTRIHTSCSVEIGPGLISGDFLVLAGTSKHNGALCPVGDGGGGDNVCRPAIHFDRDGNANPLQEGAIVAEQWAAYGVHFSSGTADSLMLFDSADPTGGDPDLGAPNEDFGGPGIGTGGSAGAPGENSKPQGLILIISEDGDQSDPDDQRNGGTIIATFDQPLDIESVSLLDIEETGGTIRAFAAGGSLLATVPITPVGNNGFQVVPVGASTASRLEVKLAGSGSVTSIEFCPGDGGGNGGGGDGTGTPGYWKNHPEAWPVEAITIGGVTYTKEQAILAMETSGSGDKTYGMFRHLVSAELNILIGNEASCIQDTVDFAQQWMTDYPLGSGVSAKSKAWKKRGGGKAHDKLVDYNEGRLCADHRG